MTDRDERCKCTMAQTMTGDGCRYCQPQEYIDRIHDDITDEQADNEKLREFTESVLKWSKAYPITIFTEPTLEQVHAVCLGLGFGIDRISGKILRECLKPWGEKAKKALGDD